MRAPWTDDLHRALFNAYFAVLCCWFLQLFVPWKPVADLAYEVAGSKQAAGWVQAVGVIIALAFGYWYPERTLKLKRREHERRQVMILRSLSLDLRSTVAPILKRLQQNVTGPLLSDAILDNWRNRIRDVDVGALDDELLVAYEAVVAFVRRMTENLREGSPPKYTASSLPVEYGNLLRATYDQLEARFRDLR